MTLAKSPRRLHWMVEAAVFLAIGLGIAKGLGVSATGTGLLALVVVLVAAQHGLAAGIVTGLFAGAIALHGGGATFNDLLELSGKRHALPPAFAHVVLGALVGLVGEGYRRALAHAHAEVERFKEQVASLQLDMSTLLAEKQSIEQRFAREVLPLEAASREAERLGNLPAGEMAGAVLSLVERFLEATSAGFYALDGDHWRLMASFGEDTTPGLRPLEDNLLSRAAFEARTLAARTPAERHAAGAWLVAPVGTPTGGCHGVLVVRELPFERLTPASVAVLGELGDRLGAALSRASEPAAPPDAHLANAPVNIVPSRPWQPQLPLAEAG